MTNLLVSGANVNFWFGTNELRKQILWDVNLSVAKGEIVLLTGPSGSGKTTLLTLVGCLRSARSGCLVVNGAEVVGASERELTFLRRRIGFIFQSHNLHRSLTALENVRMGLEVQGTHSFEYMNQRAREILALVGLDEWREHYPQQLSGGQKQRVAVARALVANPPLILADEPTAALDSKSGRDVVNLLQQLARENGTAILMVTHDNRILDIADRVVSMEDGRIRDLTAVAN
ncbi:MAG: ATP-binding cassette domain-containing protein [Candidatus Obscuribacterales bacterium]|nr:ATP-binding cassette domain-containing protein [Candidatus Obscuribacterales bacterium]